MTTQTAENTIISTRDLLRQFAQIVKFPTSQKYTIVNHGKPVATLIPNAPAAPVKPVQDQSKKHLTLQELQAKHAFHSGEPHLSERIDEIVYGVSFHE